jgi:hypothetical protein
MNRWIYVCTECVCVYIYLSLSESCTTHSCFHASGNYSSMFPEARYSSPPAQSTQPRPGPVRARPLASGANDSATARHEVGGMMRMPDYGLLLMMMMLQGEGERRG